MCNPLDAVPSDKGALGIGTPICIGLEGVAGGLNVDIGCGHVTALDSMHFGASGQYCYDVFGYQGKGIWSLDFSSTDGENWNVTVVWSGTFNNTIQTTATCTESGSGDDTAITYDLANPGIAVVQTFQNDSWFQKAKVYFELPIGDLGQQTLYVFSLAAYPGECGAGCC